MTTHTPSRCAFSSMSFAPTGGAHIVLLDSGSYPFYSNYLNQTWTFSGTDWSNTNATGPTPTRIDAVMAYDGINVMLYGGREASSQIGALGDTWTWDGTVWTKQSPVTSPFPRFKAEAAYISGASGTFMFGGQSIGTYATLLNETWEWNGTTWSQVVVANGAGPSARIGHAMAASASTAVMFGGKGDNAQFNDTWSFNGTTWSQLAPTASPSVRSDAVMSYDSTNSLWVLFGGSNEYNYLSETWTFNGTTWTQRSIGAGPTGRVGAVMGFDTTTHKTIMFGGVSATNGYPSNHTWSFDGSTFIWTLP